MPIMIFKVFLIIIFSSCLCSSSIAANTNTLNQGDIFNNSTYLVSKNGLFTLGFFKIVSPSVSTYSYLGIWYTQKSPDSPVWLANRNAPISDDSVALTIDESRKLKLIHSGGDLLTLYSAQTPTNNISAVLLDSGNFVVIESGSSSGQTLWESFDYPTDTLLPSMKLGANKKTGKKWVLTSWLAAYHIPADGAFTMEWDPRARRIVVRRRGLIYWTSGGLNGNKFEYIMEDEYQYNYKFTSVANGDEEYFTYNLTNNPILVDQSYVNVSQWSLSSQGYIVDGQKPIIGGAACQGTNTDYGCQRWETDNNCRRNGDKFEERKGDFAGSSEINYNSSLSLSDCMNLCWKDCACTGFRTLGNNGTACIFWKGDFTASLNVNSVNCYVLIPGPRPSERKDWIWVLIGVVAFLLMMLMGVFFYLRRRRLILEEKFLQELMRYDGVDDEDEFEDDENKGHNLKIYSVSSIKTATNNFSSENKLGEGGFGPVYKGKLPEEREIAVKRLSRNSGQGLVEFKNELILIAKLQHTNLVRVLGFCIQGEEKMLVYEYLSNKSLDSFLFDPSKRKLLDWKMRRNIIEGIAQGLLYLHKYSRLKIIHRDMKVSNVLLDKNMNPKISDFGLARIFRNEAEANTNRIVGTYGYMAPEYAMEGAFSVKSDVFSFGVILLEIVSGRKNNSFMLYDRALNIVGFAWEMWKAGTALELMDPTLSESCSKNEIITCINVGLLCVEDDPMDRPTMSDVIAMLSSDAATLPMPKQPAFSLAKNIKGDIPSDSQPFLISVNDATISEMDGR